MSRAAVFVALLLGSCCLVLSRAPTVEAQLSKEGPGKEDELKGALKRIAELEDELATQRKKTERRFKELEFLLSSAFEKLKEQEQQEKQPKGKPAETPLQRSQEISRLLEQPIETAGLSAVGIRLETALDWLFEKYKLPIVIDKDAFERDLGRDAPSPYEQEVRLPKIPARMVLGTALRMILSQVANGHATYILRQGHIEITTLKRSSSSGLLYQPSILASFDRRPLTEVLEELTDQSGAEIHIDPKVGKNADALISARFRHSSLENALVVVSEMAGLKYVLFERSIYVTTPDRVELLRREEADRAKIRHNDEAYTLPRYKRLEAAQ